MFISVMSVMELSIAAVGVLGALAGCIHGSKCTRIKIGCTGCECERDVAAIPEEEEIIPNQTNPNPA